MILRPTPAFAYSHPAHVIALGAGAGLARFAPGTFGTLAAWPAGWALNGADPALVFPVITAAFLLGVWACGVTGRHLGIQDHGSMVWDEIVAFLLVAAVLPRELGWQLAGFVAFRAFDIVKPAPIRWIERRFHGGFGVMLDDLVAAGYALLVLALARRLLFHG
jgi:phosphatidylglycerophosphatase A